MIRLKEFTVFAEEMLCLQRESSNLHEIEYPDDCIVDFEMALIDLFKRLEKKGLTIHELIRKEYFRVMEDIDLFITGKELEKDMAEHYDKLNIQVKMV